MVTVIAIKHIKRDTKGIIFLLRSFLKNTNSTMPEIMALIQPVVDKLPIKFAKDIMHNRPATTFLLTFSDTNRNPRHMGKIIPK
jgi:hypothetical protein